MPISHLNGLPSQDKKGLRPLGEESGELVDQNMLNFIRLFDLYTNPHTVDAGLNEHLLVLVARHGQRVEEDLRGAPGFDFGHIVSF